MLLDPKTLNVCKLTSRSPPSLSFIIFKPAASLIRAPACSTRQEMQHSERHPKRKQGGELVIDFWLQ